MAFVLLGVDHTWFLLHLHVPERVAQVELHDWRDGGKRPTWACASGPMKGGLLVGLRDDFDLFMQLRTNKHKKSPAP